MTCGKLISALIFCSIIAVTSHAQHSSFALKLPAKLPTASYQFAQPDFLNIGTFKKEIINNGIVAPDQYTQHLAFFCRQEIIVEKKLHTSVILRMGSVESANYLEQKPGYEILAR